MGSEQWGHEVAESKCQGTIEFGSLPPESTVVSETLLGTYDPQNDHGVAPFKKNPGAGLPLMQVDEEEKSKQKKSVFADAESM